MKGFVLTLLTALFLFACTSESDRQVLQVDHLNDQSYHFRYINIDSALHYANAALHASTGYSEGKAEAIIHRAFVSYQQMNYDVALNMLSQVKSTTRNQYNLLCAHILTMKIAQRIGDGEVFFSSRNQAARILQRIQDSKEEIDTRHRRIINYAKSELHIVSSTYYYYLSLDSAAINEIQQAYEIVQYAADTAQWLYYHYMIGSGGLLKGDSQEILREEFDCLFRTYTLSTQEGYTYFQANALQSLATMLSDSASYHYLRNLRGASFDNLFQQHIRWGAAQNLPLALARHSISLFQKSKDLFQTASAHRTLGEVYFQNGQFALAHKTFQNALSLVETQKHRSTYSVLPWMASIREKLCMTYSALGDVERSEQNRAVYLQLLDKFRQNYESETRLQELTHEVHSLHNKITILLILVALTLTLLFVLMYRMKSRVKTQARHLVDFFNATPYQALEEEFSHTLQQLDEQIDEMQDQLQVSRLHLNTYKSENVERRAKVELVYSIIPYLERMISEGRRMQSEGIISTERLLYIQELSTEILRINDALTDWIKMSQGKLKLHITTFPLQEVLDVITLSRGTFEQKGIRLHVATTASQVKADRSLTLFMVNTLCDNARKFTPAGGDVSIHLHEEESYIEIQVHDTGVGLSQSDVSTLNDNKFYDARRIGNGEKKGFGFGIMNCRGIINKYRKTAQLFQVCDFGVKSQIGKGSTFWFRLPRVLSLLFIFLFTQYSQAATSPLEAGINSMRTANSQSEYATALQLGLTLQQQLTSPLDTALAISLYNETAIAALALHEWEVYKSSNAEYVRLHQLYTRDASIEAYCTRMQKMQSDTAVLYAFLILFIVVSAILFYILFLRPRLRNDRRMRHINGELARFMQLTRHSLQSFAARTPRELQTLLEADDLEHRAEPIHQQLIAQLQGETTYRESVDRIFHRIGTRYDQLLSRVAKLIRLHDDTQKFRFEEDRLYVMNQILDNCLSTIKHETMYYPARAKQLVETILKYPSDKERLHELNSLLTYYKEVYMLLYQQAEHQLEQNNFKRTVVSVSDLSEAFVQQSHRIASRLQRQEIFRTDLHSSPLQVVGDSQLLQTLLQSLYRDHLTTLTQVFLTATAQDRLVEFLLTLTFTTDIDADTLPLLFTPGHASISHLIARQVIREHDSHCGYPGLRLYAEAHDSCSIRIHFTLQQPI